MVKLIILFLFITLVILWLAFLKGSSISSEIEKQKEDDEQIRWLKEYEKSKRK